MRLLTTCLSWELAQQPPVLLTDVKSVTSDGVCLIVTYDNGEVEKIVDDHEITFRILA